MLGALIGLLATTFVLVPLDDRPVTLQLPVMIGAIAGVRVDTPPRALLGRYLQFGDPDGLAAWLASTPADASADVVSADMLAYGGLIAARTPQTPEGVAIARLRALAAFRAQRPSSWFATFGTVMRLAPTGVPDVGAGKGFFLAGDAWPLVQRYANLPDPPVTAAQRATAAGVRALIGPQLDAYLATRARDRNVDLFLLRQLAENGYDRLVLGQDDAGPVGLHLRDLAALRAFAERWDPPGRASIEPGADELGMALIGAALARQAAFVPSVRVTYSRADGAAFNDPLEFAPVDTTVGALIRTCGAERAAPGAGDADIELYVRVPATADPDERAFTDAIARDVAAGKLVAVADLSFLAAADLDQQRTLVDALIARKIAGELAAFASWNTTANTVGTALPEAIAVAAGRRMGTYDALAHDQFMLDRYADDYAFHTYTRPALNSSLSAAGTSDHTYLLPGLAGRTEEADRADLWPRTLTLLHTVYPADEDAGLTITLPWDRTFETELDVRLRPR
jgi:hypothetical protein